MASGDSVVAGAGGSVGREPIFNISLQLFGRGLHACRAKQLAAQFGQVRERRQLLQKLLGMKVF